MSEVDSGKVPSSPANANVLSFLELHGLSHAPVYLTYVNKGYDAEYCHLSAKHCANTQGGEECMGGSLWDFKGLIIADFHSVWENPNGDLIDVTPPRYGNSQILFVRDEESNIVREKLKGKNRYIMPCNRSSDVLNPYYFLGTPSESDVMAMEATKPDLIRYCSKHKMKPLDMVTEDDKG